MSAAPEPLPTPAPLRVAAWDGAVTVDTLAGAVRDPLRLAAVRGTHLLDVPAAPAVGRIVALAARLLKAPTAVLTIVDGDRDVIKAHVGLPDEVAATGEVRAFPSFCQIGIARHHATRALPGADIPSALHPSHGIDAAGAGPLLVVGDARNDPEFGTAFAAMPSVAMGVRACVTAPLLDARGQGVGSLCVLDFATRRWTEEEIAILGDLANAAAGEIALHASVVDLALANAQLQEQTAELELQATQLEEQQTELEAINLQLQETAAALEREAAALAASEAQFRAMAESIPQLAWTARADGHIDWYNQRWYAYTGTTPDQMAGWGWQDVHDPALLPDVVARWQASLASGEAFEMEFPLRGVDGRFRWHLTRVEPMRDAEGRVARWFGTNTDVQAHRESREAAERAREAAEAANAAKSQFLATMSHELRTPLNAITGYADLITLGIRGPTTPEQLEDLGRVRRSSQHLLALINDILNFAKLEAGQVEVRHEPVDVGAALADAEALVAPQVAARGLSLAVEAPAGPVYADGDAEKLRQILLNLLTNALKFTDAGGAITAGTSATAGLVSLSVADTGRGIAPEQLERVFEPFVQVDRHLTQQSQQGVGLGLAISRELARAMGGDLTVESRPGAGSRFVLTLPRAAAPAAPGSA